MAKRRALLAAPALLLVTACGSPVQRSPDYRAWLQTLPEEAPSPSSVVDVDMQIAVAFEESLAAEGAPAEPLRLRGSMQGRIEILDSQQWRCELDLEIDASALPIGTPGPARGKLTAVADGRSLWLVLRPQDAWLKAAAGMTAFSGVVEIPFEVMDDSASAEFQTVLKALIEPARFVGELDEGQTQIELVEASDEEMHWQIQVRTDGTFPGPAGEAGGMSARYDLRVDRASGFPRRLEAVAEGGIEGRFVIDWTRREPSSWGADHFRFRAPVGYTIHRVNSVEELLQPLDVGAEDEDL